MVDAKCNSKLLLLCFICLSCCCKPSASCHKIAQLLSKEPGESLVHILSPEITLSRSTHQNLVYEAFGGKGEEREKETFGSFFD